MWIILLDHSESMGDPFTGKSVFTGRSRTSKAAIKLDAAKQALLEHLQGLGSPTDITLIEFTSSASVVFNGSSDDLRSIQHHLDSLQAEDGTDISVALDLAAEYESTLQNVMTVRILIISDGLSDLEQAKVSAQKVAARRVIIDLILIDPTEDGEAVARAITAWNGSFWAVTTPEELSDRVAVAGEQERTQMELAAAIIGTYEKEAIAVIDKIRAEDRLAFTAGYPSVVSPEVWNSLLVYLHTAKLKDQIEDMLNQRGSQSGFRLAKFETGAFLQVKRGTILKLTPRIEGFVFNPPTSLEVAWYEDIQEIPFRLKAEPHLAGSPPVLGSVEVEINQMLIAQIPLSIRVRAPGEPLEPIEVTTKTAQSYNSIFCSYSYKDKNIVNACKAAYEALGVFVYIDKSSLKSGEEWNPALHQLIQKSDLFQLYWSTASCQSPNVEDEWRYAVSIRQQKDECFIRPLRWEEPLPPLPPELSRIHVGWLDLGVLARVIGHPISFEQEIETPIQNIQIDQNPLYATVLPMLPNIGQEIIASVREDVAQAVLFLENLTGLRYYPAPTLLVDDYAVKSVRALDTIDFSPDNSNQRDRALALADIINSICLDFHLRNLRPQTISKDDFPEFFGSAHLFTSVQFNAIRKHCESIGFRIEDFIKGKTDEWWQRARSELLDLNLSAFSSNITFVNFISIFLDIVRQLLQEGLQTLGDFEFQSTYSIKSEAWQLLHKELPNLQMQSGRTNADKQYLVGPFEEFVRIFDRISTQLIEALTTITHYSGTVCQDSF